MRLLARPDGLSAVRASLDSSLCPWATLGYTRCKIRPGLNNPKVSKR